MGVGDRLADRTDRLRHEVLMPSGGWLGEGIILISDLTGAWDIFVFMALFVVFWIIIRTTYMEISFALGCAFDIGIPLQYSNHEKLKALHARHLDDYWPIVIIGTLVESGAYLLFYPDLFTLVVALKTSFCLLMWLIKRPDSSRVSFRPTYSSSQDPKPTVSHPPATSARQPAAPKPARPPRPANPPAPSPNSRWVDKRFPDLDRRLRKLGYTEPAARAGASLGLTQLDDEKAGKNYAAWTSNSDPNYIARKTKDWGAKAKRYNWPAEGLSIPEAEGTKHEKALEQYFGSERAKRWVKKAKSARSDGEAGDVIAQAYNEAATAEQIRRSRTAPAQTQSSGVRPARDAPEWSFGVPEEQLKQLEGQMAKMPAEFKNGKNLGLMMRDFRAARSKEELEYMLIGAGLSDVGKKEPYTSIDIVLGSGKEDQPPTGPQSLGLPNTMVYTAYWYYQQQNERERRRLLGVWGEACGVPSGPVRRQKINDIRREIAGWQAEYLPEFIS